MKTKLCMNCHKQVQRLPYYLTCSAACYAQVRKLSDEAWRSAYYEWCREVRRRKLGFVQIRDEL